MKKYASLLLACAAAFASCRNYSRFPIDENPRINSDNNLLGIWKAVEDTNKLDYILVQNATDLYGITSDKVANEELSAAGKRKMVAANSNLLRQTSRFYYLTRQENDGTNPHYFQWHSYLSKIGNVRFLNVAYRNVEKEAKDGTREEGYFFVKVIKLTQDSLVTAIVADPTLRFLKNTSEVRSRIAKHLNNPYYYSDTLHFYKVSNYHASVDGSVHEANK